MVVSVRPGWPLIETRQTFLGVGFPASGHFESVLYELLVLNLLFSEEKL